MDVFVVDLNANVLWVSPSDDLKKHGDPVGTNAFHWVVGRDLINMRSLYAEAIISGYSEIRGLTVSTNSGPNILDVRLRRINDVLVGYATSHVSIRLTDREFQVLLLICDGATISEQSSQLGISSSTCESHRAALLRKTGAKGTAGLVRWAIRHGVLLNP